MNQKLGNGIRVVGEKLPNFRSASIGIWVRAGVTTETPAENGLSHFLEHMLFKGTKNRTAEQIAAEMDDIGGQLNAFTAKECTCFYSKAIDDKLDTAVNVLCDMFCNSVFAPEEIEKERGVVLEEISMSNDTPDDVAHENACSLYFVDTPLAKTILGPASNIRTLGREQIDSYVNQQYGAQNVVISVAGSFEEKQLIDSLERGFASMDARRSETPLFDYMAYTPKRGYLAVDKEIEQVHLCLALPGYGFTDPNRFALSVVSNLLGGTMSSRLFQKIREQAGAAYSVFSYTSNYVGAGMLGIYAGTSKEKAYDVLGMIEKELSRLKRERITNAELQRCKEQLRGSYVLSQESTSARMNALGKNMLLTDRVISDEEVLRELDRVTMDDIEAALDRMLAEDKRCGVCVGRPKHAKQIEEALR